jgi:hypothetical protein
MAAVQHTATETAIAGSRALAIAEADALLVYRDLSMYRIELWLDTDGWHVEYYLNKRRWAGDGPHYVIDAATGAIVSKTYYQ